MRGRGALSGGSTRGARGAGAEPSGAKVRILQELHIITPPLIILKTKSVNQSQKAHRHIFLAYAPPWIAPQLRAQGHMEARRQQVVRLREHIAKDRLAVRRDAAARRQWLAAGGAGAAEVLDLLWRPARRPAIKGASNAER